VKAVLDTNIYVSAIALPGGQAEKALLAALHGHYRVAISKPIIHEVLDVLARKFDRDPEALARVAVFLDELGTLVHPRKTLDILKDTPDNRILECAATARAHYIVTGDRAMLGLGHYQETRIVTLRAFLDLLETH
jgi:putative PIN family toxin of toxin-antitoxin system